MADMESEGDWMYGKGGKRAWNRSEFTIEDFYDARETEIKHLVTLDGNPVAKRNFTIEEEDFMPKTIFQETDPDYTKYAGYMGNEAGDTSYYPSFGYPLFRSELSTGYLGRLAANIAYIQQTILRDSPSFKLCIANLPSERGALETLRAESGIQKDNIGRHRVTPPPSCDSHFQPRLTERAKLGNDGGGGEVAAPARSQYHKQFKCFKRAMFPPPCEYVQQQTRTVSGHGDPVMDFEVPEPRQGVGDAEGLNLRVQDERETKACRASVVAWTLVGHPILSRSGRGAVRQTTRRKLLSEMYSRRKARNWT
ncbi:hypothetical protein B0H13DRAFT_1927769, partial [Mycena leptocephala]